MSKKKWIKDAIKEPGSFTAWCKTKWFDWATQECIQAWLQSPNEKTRKRANLAKTLKWLRRG